MTKPCGRDRIPSERRKLIRAAPMASTEWYGANNGPLIVVSPENYSNEQSRGKRNGLHSVGSTKRPTREKNKTKNRKCTVGSTEMTPSTIDTEPTNGSYLEDRQKRPYTDNAEPTNGFMRRIDRNNPSPTTQSQQTAPTWRIDRNNPINQRHRANS